MANQFENRSAIESSDLGISKSNNNQFSRSEIRIDGINYAFKHIIRGYISPRTKRMMKNKKIKKIPRINMERANLLHNSSSVMESLKSMSNDFLMHQNTKQFIEENSLYSEEEEESIHIVDQEELNDCERDTIFRFNYGIQKHIPHNFIPHSASSCI